MEPALFDIPDAGVLQDNEPAPEGDEKVTMPDDDPILRKKTLKLGEVDEDDEDDDKVGNNNSWPFLLKLFWYNIKNNMV